MSLLVPRARISDQHRREAKATGLVATHRPGVARWLCLMVLLVSTAPLSTGAQPAAAAPTADDAEARATAKAHNARARNLFVLGRFREAAAEYEKAHEAKPLPTFLFNLAQCYKRLGTADDLDRAVFYYRGYLRSTPGGKDHGRVEAQIADLRARAAKLRAAVPAAEPKHPDPDVTPPKQPDPDVTPPKLPVGGAVPAVRDGQPVTGPTGPPSRPLYTRWWLWTAVGVAVVGGSVAAIVAATTGGDDRVPGGPPHDWTSFKLRGAP